MVIVLRRLEVGATTKAEKRCRTATPWPIALCFGPLIVLRNHAVMTASEDRRRVNPPYSFKVERSPNDVAHLAPRPNPRKASML
jgi:hypothetical protein